MDAFPASLCIEDVFVVHRTTSMDIVSAFSDALKMLMDGWMDGWIDSFCGFLQIINMFLVLIWLIWRSGR